jgi:hypothetical protein
MNKTALVMLACLSLASCETTDHELSPSTAKNVEGPEPWDAPVLTKQEVLKLVGDGMWVEQAVKVLRAHGFYCSLASDEKGMSIRCLCLATPSDYHDCSMGMGTIISRSIWLTMDIDSESQLITKISIKPAIGDDKPWWHVSSF